MAARCSRLMLAGVAVLALVLLVNAGSSAATYNFNDAAAEAALDGVHGGLDFDIGMWRGSSGIGGLDQCARFSAIGCTFRAFHLPPLAILTSIRISSGWAAGTYAIRDGVNPEVKGELESNAPVTVTTDWAKPSVTITVELSMGADAGIDDVIYALSGTPPDLTTVTFQQDTDGYTGTVDTYVSRDNPTTSYGASTRAYVKGDSAGQVQEALIRFDGIFGASFDQIPPGAIISSATLTVTSGKANGGIASCFRMLTGWDATSTWNSLDNGIELADVEYLTPLEGWNGSGIGSGVPISYRVTGSVQAWANDPASNFGWVFRCPPDNNSWNFYSSQWATNPAARPKLEVSYATQPLVLPVFNVTDQTSQSSVFTDSATVNVSLLAYVEQGGAITGYAITEENVSPDPFEEGEWSPLPSTYAIKATPPAAVTLYAWVRDDYWNVAGAVDSIYYSAALPTVANIIIVPGYDRATISWETDAAAVCWVEYGSGGGQLVQVTPLGRSDREHSVTIKDLTPSTGYDFRIHADAAVSLVESFATTDAGLFHVGFQTDEPPRGILRLPERRLVQHRWRHAQAHRRARTGYQPRL